MLKRLLEGKPLGHPLHPLLVHLPIGLFIISFAFDIGAIILPFAPPDYFLRPAFFTMLLGVIAALLAAVFGFIDYLDIRRDSHAHQLANYHMWLNLLVVGLYIVNVIIRWHRLQRSFEMVLPVVLSFCALIALGVSGYIGGLMIYDDGIAVGRLRRSGKTPRTTLDLSDRITPDGFVDVTADADLADRQTLRVRAGGVVMAIAKADGQVYAFQDFCTHRFGPLSEGSFANGQVICPWHRSCFDMLTGKVCHGPAKENIRTFEVQIRNGRVMVRVPGERT